MCLVFFSYNRVTYIKKITEVIWNCRTSGYSNAFHGNVFLHFRHRSQSCWEAVLGGGDEGGRSCSGGSAGVVAVKGEVRSQAIMARRWWWLLWQRWEPWRCGELWGHREPWQVESHVGMESHGGIESCGGMESHGGMESRGGMESCGSMESNGAV